MSLASCSSTRCAVARCCIHAGTTPPFSLASSASSNSSRSRNSSRKRLLNDSLTPFSHGLPGATWIGSVPLPGSQLASASQTNSLPLSLRMLPGALALADHPRQHRADVLAGQRRATCRARHSLVYSSTKVSQRSGPPDAVRSATKSYAQTSFLNRAGRLVQLLALVPRLGPSLPRPPAADRPLQARLAPQLGGPV